MRRSGVRSSSSPPIRCFTKSQEVPKARVLRAFSLVFPPATSHQVLLHPSFKGGINWGYMASCLLYTPQMPLTDTAIRNAKSAATQRKLADEKGLFLLVILTAPNIGASSTVLKAKKSCWPWGYIRTFRSQADSRKMKKGDPIEIKGARKLRDEARELLAQEIDPGASRKAHKAVKQGQAANSFEVIAREWFAKFSHEWAPSHSDKIIKRLEKDVFPWIGNRPISEIKSPELLAVIRRTESRGALDTTHRVKQNCGQVFRYAVATGRAERDPSQDLKDAIPSTKKNHFASITDPVQVGELLRAIEGFRGTFVVQCALALPLCCSCVPGNYGAPNGKILTSINPNGVTSSQRQRRSIWFRSPLKLCQFFGSWKR